MTSASAEAPPGVIRVVFLGTPEFAVPVLRGLHQDPGIAVDRYRLCTRGGISVRVPYETTIGVGSNAKVITNFKTVQEPCGTCDGKGYTECPLCKGDGRESRK